MPHLEQPSYEELAARNAELTARVSELLAVVAEQAALIETLRTEVAAVRRQAGPGFSKLFAPPGKDRPPGGAEAKASREARRGGTPGPPPGRAEGPAGG